MNDFLWGSQPQTRKNVLIFSSYFAEIVLKMYKVLMQGRAEVLLFRYLYSAAFSFHC